MSTDTVTATASTTTRSLTEDEVDDVLYCARANELEELKGLMGTITGSVEGFTEKAVLAAAVDPVSGNTALHYAAANGHKDVVEYLLKIISSTSSEEVSSSSQTSTTSPTQSSSSTAQSSQDVNTTIGNKLTMMINHKNGSGNTALHWAALNGHIEIVSGLLKAGSDPTVLNDSGHDAVFEAELAGKEDVVDFLLKEGAGLDSVFGGLDISGLDCGAEGEGEEDEGEVEEEVKVEKSG